MLHYATIRDFIRPLWAQATMIKKIPIYEVIHQNGAVAKSHMTNGLLIYGEIFAHFLIY
jgi:hypothetical protein